MDDRRRSELALPYGKIAIWGIGLSVVLTGAVLLATPFSPVRLAEEVLDDGPDVRAVLPLQGTGLPSAAEASRRAVREVLGDDHAVEHRWLHEDRWVHVMPELGIGLSRELSYVLPELGAELSREWARTLPELSAELSREWTKIAPELREEMRRELRRELRGLRVEIDRSPSPLGNGG